MYADDLAFYTSSNKFILAAERLQADISHVAEWCSNKRLTVNTDKKNSTCIWISGDLIYMQQSCVSYRPKIDDTSRLTAKRYNIRDA